MKVIGGKPFYGDAIGILMLDNRRYPKIPGDVGNASSYDFPVRIRVVPNLNNNPFPPIHGDDGELTPEVRLTVEAVREMEAEGVRAIALCCGFFFVDSGRRGRSGRHPGVLFATDDDPLDPSDVGQRQGGVRVNRVQKAVVA